MPCDWPAWLRLFFDGCVLWLLWYAYALRRRNDNQRISLDSLTAMIENMRKDPRPEAAPLTDAEVSRLASELIAHMRNVVRGYHP